MAFSLLPNYLLFYHDFNLANLEEKYFVGLKFHNYDEKIKVIKVLETSTVYTGARVLNCH